MTSADWTVVTTAALGLVGTAGIAIAAGLVRLSNATSSLATKIDGMDSRVVRLEDTIFPTVFSPPHQDPRTPAS